jgi:hypothetical protein
MPNPRATSRTNRRRPADGELTNLLGENDGHSEFTDESMSRIGDFDWSCFDRAEGVFEYFEDSEAHHCPPRFCRVHRSILSVLISGKSRDPTTIDRTWSTT